MNPNDLPTDEELALMTAEDLAHFGYERRERERTLIPWEWQYPLFLLAVLVLGLLVIWVSQ